MRHSNKKILPTYDKCKKDLPETPVFIKHHNRWFVWEDTVSYVYCNNSWKECNIAHNGIYLKQYEKLFMWIDDNTFVYQNDAWYACNIANDILILL